ncbi:MAG: hypothetical protein A2676_03455 [Candidatus Sungbacteria bacterium RIFCSPHIGHO2_01_FULL_51_22]|nr:MAG: hypothetical protein A2676_03455 [Candidatus Sungbacteria bacterium RIFCSPHIGHO2_01_FULL_51_22]
MRNIMNKKPAVGIVALGMVGDQLRRWFASKGHPMYAYDKFKGVGALSDLHAADVIFLCLPTPHSKKHVWGVDLSSFELVAKFFTHPKTFVVKSTVPPGTTAHLQKRFPRHRFLHNPEFLTESTAWYDFIHPVAQLVGYTHKSKGQAARVLAMLPRSKTEAALSSEATEIFKYARNAYFANKVIFANHVYDLAGAFGVSYDSLKDIMKKDPWIGANHLEVVHRGYRGFGGKCLPKDLKTLIRVMRARHVDAEVFEAVDRSNGKLLSKQKLEKTLNTYWLNNTNAREA